MALEELLSKLNRRQQQQEKIPPSRRRLQKKRHLRQYPQPPSPPPPSLTPSRDSSHTYRTNILHTSPSSNRFGRESRLSISSHTSTNSTVTLNAATSPHSMRSATATSQSTFSEQVSSLHNAENPEELCVAIVYSSKDFKIQDLRPINPVSRLPSHIRKILDEKKEIRRLATWRKEDEDEARLRGWDRDDIKATEANLNALRGESSLEGEIQEIEDGV